MADVKATLLEKLGKLTDDEKKLLAMLFANTPQDPPKKFVYGGRFWTTVSRYVDGKYIMATPEHPQLVTFSKKLRTAVDDEGVPLDRSLVPANDEVAKPQPPKEKLIPPYAKTRRGPPDRRPAEVEEEGDTRPSDVDPT